MLRMIGSGRYENARYGIVNASITYSHFISSKVQDNPEGIYHG